MRAAYDWFMRNKFNLGAVCGFAAMTLLTGNSQHIPYMDASWCITAGFVLSQLALALGASGVVKSDDYYRDKQGK